MINRPRFRKRRKLNWYQTLLIVGGFCAAMYAAIKLGASDIGWLIP